MGLWKELGIHKLIKDILVDVPAVNSDSYLGIPYVTAYQIAIEFAFKYPRVLEKIERSADINTVGQRIGLARYLADELSSRIRSGEITDIEGGFLSSQHLRDISFNPDEHLVIYSSDDTSCLLSMFRIRK